MTDWLYIAAGGACGAMARHGTNLLTARWCGETFPYGTLAVNVAGCFAIGIVWQLLANADAATAADQPPAAWRGFLQHALATGFLGGLTTFSSFGLQTVLLAQKQDWMGAGANVALNLVLGLVSVVAGAAVIRGVS